MKTYRTVLALVTVFAVAAAASAQTPQQVQRQRILQSIYYQQMAAQQALYPTPFSPFVANLSYAQYANQLSVAQGRGPLPVPSTVQSNQILLQAQMMQYAMYPQAMVGNGIPMNYMAAIANGGVGTIAPLPYARIPTTPDEYNRMVAAQQQAVNALVESGAVVPGLVQPQAGGPARMMQGAVAQGLRQLGLVGPQARPWNRIADAGRLMNVGNFREAPGERELELGRLWIGVDVQKAKELFVQAEGLGDPAVIDKARKELKALADQK